MKFIDKKRQKKYIQQWVVWLLDTYIASILLRDDVLTTARMAELRNWFNKHMQKPTGGIEKLGKDRGLITNDLVVRRCGGLGESHGLLHAQLDL